MSKPKNTEPIQSVKGMHDILPDLVPYYDRVIRELRRVAEFYGFQIIRTPHVERRELFTTTLGETSDVVEKQMYAFRTRGGSAVVLRPEGTAPIMRAFQEHRMWDWSQQPVKLFYSGAFFRHENPQAGRTREFYQAGIEILGSKESGSDDPSNDALIIRILVSALDVLHIRNIIVHINSIGDKDSRNAYVRELGQFYKRRQHALCKDCKRRLKENPMRLLDCKNEECVQVKKEAPHMVDYLSETAKQHFQEVLDFLDQMNIPYMLDPLLVRGLDYYTNTVFEIFVEGEAEKEPEKVLEKEAEKVVEPESMNSSEGGEIIVSPQTKEAPKEIEKEEEKDKAPIAIASGGRYDTLGNVLFGKSIPAVGGALGVDRIVAEMQRRGLKVRPEISPKVFIVQLGPLAKKKCFLITEELRKSGIPFAHSISRDDLRKQLRTADKMGTPYALIIGQKEAVEERAILRAMDTGAQEIVPFMKIVTTLKLRLKQL